MLLNNDFNFTLSLKKEKKIEKFKGILLLHTQELSYFLQQCVGFSAKAISRFFWQIEVPQILFER